MGPSKQRWLLLRGLARGQGHWGRFLEMFKEKFPDCEVQYLDLPGNGIRNHETSPLAIKEYVRDLRSRCEFVKQKQPFQILALSMGAMIAVEWMHSHPHEIQRSFLVGTSSAGHSRFYERFRPNNFIDGFPLMHAKNSADWEKVILSMIVNDPARRQQELPALEAFSRAHPVRMENVFRQLWAASRYRFPRKAPGDVTLIGSWGDRLVAPVCTLNLAKAWGLEARMHSQAGHDIPIDDPRWLLEQLI